ncbi:hypothetical protein GCM10017673_57670 [Streptosporangium violaceochromogenes]|nr:hypothetical protein GCM10017673_57670 [Streptosporangium violaceochromogenes]
MTLSTLIPPLAWQVAAGIVAAVALTILWFAVRYARRHPLEDVLTIVAAGIATAVAASGMWQFLERVMPTVAWGWRLLMFAFIEVAVIASAVRARRNMRDNYSAGIDGIAVWALTALSAVLSAMEAASLPEAVFRLAAPLVAAWLWERGMAIERHRATGRKRINWRLTPERILVRLGLAEAQDRTADEVDAYRRLTRIAFAAKKARRLELAGAAAWRQHRALRALDRAVDKAIEHARLADDPERQAAMLTRIRASLAAAELRHVAAVAPWAALEHPADTGTGQVALASGATEEVADSATDTTPAPATVACAEPNATDTRSATTDTDTTPPVAPPAPARTKNATDTQADTDTGDATLTATANATDAMLRHWRNATSEGRVPTGAELAREGRCAPSYGRRMRKLWLAELETGQQPLAPITVPVNGHRHHDGGDA